MGSGSGRSGPGTIQPDVKFETVTIANQWCSDWRDERVLAFFNQSKPARFFIISKFYGKQGR